MPCSPSNTHLVKQLLLLMVMFPVLQPHQLLLLQEGAFSCHILTSTQLATRVHWSTSCWMCGGADQSELC
jgi:hypothetical protein